jgi:hypothetical protein
MKQFFAILFLSFTFIYIFGCENSIEESVKSTSKNSSRITTTTYKGLYVDQFNTILGDTTQENNLLRWCNKYGFNAISLYDLNTILGNSRDNQLASFIKKARTQYSIAQVAAVRATTANFTQNATYDASRVDLNERFNVYNLENEWWNNGASCNFTCYTTILQAMKQKAKAANPAIVTEAYIGWFQNPTKPAQQAPVLITNLDRLLIHDYRVAPDFVYMKDRLSYIGQAAQSKGKVFDIIVLFSAESAFMGNYFSITGQNKTFDDAYTELVNQYNASTFTGKANVRLIGYQIFTYSLAKSARP